MGRWQDDQAARGRPYDGRDRNGGYQQQQDWRGGQGGSHQQQQEQQQYGQGQGATNGYFPQPYSAPFPQQPFLPFNPMGNPSFYPNNPFPSPGWMPNPAALPFQPSFPAFSPFQPSQPAYGYGNWSGGGWTGGSQGGWGVSGVHGGGGEGQGRRGGGNDPWSTGDYRPHQQGGSYRNQNWQRNDGPSSSSYDPSHPSLPREPHFRHRSSRSRSPQHTRFSRSSSPAPYESRHPGPPTDAPTGPRSQGDQGYTNAPSYGPNGEYIPPQRRQKRDKRTAPVAGPTNTYLAAAEIPSKAYLVEEVDAGTAGEGEENGPEPPLLVLDLNHTLLCRAKRTSWGSRQPLVRPYLSTFLEYICSSSTLPSAQSTDSSSSTSAPSSPPTRRPRFLPVVYSSARAPNVLSMLAALSLIPPSRLPSFAASSAYNYVSFGPPPYSPSPEEGDVLAMVFTREMMGLSKTDYAGDVETTKDIGKVWEEMGWGGFKAWRLEERRIRAAGGAEAEAEAGERNPDEVDLGSDVSGGEDGKGPEGFVSEGKNRRKTPNKKTKARMERLRDELGARRTLLLDDEASKAAQQPYNHLPIRPFIVLPTEFPPPVTAAPPSSSSLPPTSPAPSSSSRPASPPRFAPPPPLAALQLPSTHPAAAEDSHLLGTIYLLERLRGETNISFVVKGGFFARVREEVKKDLLGTEGEGKEVTEREVDEELAKRGRAVCEKVGIEVRREWDERWREKVLEKAGRGVSKP